MCETVFERLSTEAKPAEGRPWPSDDDDDDDGDNDDDDDDGADDEDDEETSMIVGAEQMLRLGEGGATRFWSSKALENANIEILNL